MLHRNSIGAVALAVTLLAGLGAARAFDDGKYPNFSGQWLGVRPPGVGGQPGFDPYRPWGLGQQAPLTAEYQKVLEASIADQVNGGQGNWKPGADCVPPGMPGMMTAFQAMEMMVLPEITYIRIDHVHDSHRRIYTDGSDWPAKVEPSLIGYSIGHWIDDNHDGRFTTLEVETRYLRGPRSLDPAGMPVHADNQSIIQERFYLDKANPNILHNDLTLIDHAFTRPWTVLKTYERNPDRYPSWIEYPCAGDQELIKIGAETYYRAGDGNLMPTRRDQPPPDLRNFK
jgi:hypothetical protein